MRRDEKTANRLEVLDGLRGLAIALVVFFHFWQKSWWNPLEKLPWLECLPRRGYFGVEIFFFLSGFCLYLPLARSSKWPGLRHYFSRRALKILPSYWLCLVAALLLIPEREVAVNFWLHFFSHLSFLHSLTFETYGSIHGVFWSLGVEVQFYVLFPLLAILFIRRPIIGPLLGWLLLALIAFFYRRWVVQGGMEGRGYTMQMNQLPGFLDLFGGGMAAAALTVVLQKRLTPHPAWSLLLVAGLAALLWLFRSADSHNQGHDAAISYQAAIRFPLALLLLLTTIGGALTPLRCGGLLRFLAAISYNLYLWHTLVATLLQKAMGITEPWKVTDEGLRIRFTLVALVVSLVVAALLTYGFELPLLRRARRPISSFRE
ncbi:acyltransferase family protein [Armatimonas sp.]|uniref:acyltransferase family protein n=1 Tax=Armatimonas sp. TaxID=1872638 RepID=UPI003753A800